jgi:parvulin-like peptidyl-prolyl isomerase
MLLTKIKRWQAIFLITWGGTGLILLPGFAKSKQRIENAGNILAVVGKRIITTDAFTRRYHQIKQKFNLPDNGESRTEVLNYMVEEELLISEAITRGYQDDEQGHFESRRLRIQGLLDAYLDTIVLKNLTIDEKELKVLYQRLNTKVKARHLYAASRSEADSIYTLLNNGHSFANLAKERFADPRLRDNAGSLGYFTVDEMDPAFEEAAFSLKIGEISRPVHTAQGYSIIQVEDRITRPLLTETEYAKSRPELERYWRIRKKRVAIGEYSNSLRKTLGISFEPKVINELMRIIKQTPVSSDADDLSFLIIEEPLGRQTVVHSKLGDWDVNMVYQSARFTDATQRRWIRNSENLEDFIAGLVIRAEILRRAEKLGLDKTPEFEQMIRGGMDDYLLERINRDITEATVIPEDTLRAYFQENRGSFIIPPKVKLREIVLDDKLIAQKVLEQLQTGGSFEDLGQQYSIRSSITEYPGDIGAFTYQELEPYGEVIFSLEIGDWTGPIMFGSQFGFYKCVGKTPRQVQNFSEARPAIEKALRPVYMSHIRQELLSDIRQRIKVETFPNRLRTI